MSKRPLQSAAARWMLEGIREHEAFNAAFRSARAHAINAGFFFLSARQQIADGNWGEFLFGYNHKISERAVRFYMLLATEAIEWVKHAQPQLAGLDKIQAAARDLVMESPKPLVALARELGFMRRFGEYDAVKYATRKRLGDAGQIEFEFTAAEHTLDLLCDPKVVLKFPESADQHEALTELKGKLQSATARVEHLLQNATPIET